MVRFAGFGIEQINPAELFVDKNIRTCVDRFQIEAIVRQYLFHAFAFGVVGEERDRPVAIGKKIDCVAHPDRIVVIGILARHFFQLKVVEPNNVDRRGLPAAIALPGILPSQIGNVRNARAIRRKRCAFTSPHRENFRHAAVNGNSVEPLKISVRLPGGRE